MSELFHGLGTNWAGVAVQVVVFGVIAAIVPISLAVWMYRDSAARGDQAAAAWAVGGVLCWPITLIVFLITRTQRPR